MIEFCLRSCGFPVNFFQKPLTFPSFYGIIIAVGLIIALAIAFYGNKLK